MKVLQKTSKFLSDYTSIVVIAIAVITFFVPGIMSWVNYKLFVDFAANKFTTQSIIIGIIMFSMGLTLTAQDFKILAKRPFDICVGAIAQYLINAVSCIWNYKGTRTFRCDRTWSYSCRMLSGRCIIKYYVLPLRRRRCIFSRHDNCINNPFSVYDTAFSIFPCKRNTYLN